MCPEQQFTRLWRHTSSAKRNSGQKPKLSVRDRRTLKRIVSINRRSTTAKVTAELNVHLPFPQKQSDESFTNPTSMVELQLLITVNSDKRWKIWLDVPSFTFPTSGWVYVWTSPKEASNPECLVPIVKHGDRSVMSWAAVSSILLLLYLLWMIELLLVTTWTL